MAVLIRASRVGHYSLLKFKIGGHPRPSAMARSARPMLNHPTSIVYLQAVVEFQYQYMSKWHVSEYRSL
jgi:hypothetical protein